MTTPAHDGAVNLWDLDDVWGKSTYYNAEVAFHIGRTSESGNEGYSIGAGFSGFAPYLDGYVQLNRESEHSYGLGSRVSISPVGYWHELRVYGRYDYVLPKLRLLLNPTVVYHGGGSSGSYFAYAQGVGILVKGWTSYFVPSITVVFARGGDIGRVYSTMFVVAGIGLTFHSRDVWQ